MPDSNDWGSERAALVEHLRQRGVTSQRVLDAIAKVPRHDFVPTAVRNRAYETRPLHIGHRQTISAPYIVGSMTELLELEADDRVLEIGTGCGYQTAVLCEIAREVYSIEIVPELAAFAADNLAALGYAPALRVGDGYAGWPEQAPFNACIVAATAASLPPPLLEQLAPGGRLVAPVLGDDGREWMMRYRRTPSGIQSEALYAVRFVPLTRASRD